MKKQLASNIFLSLGILFFLIIIIKFSSFNISSYYYFTVFFFFLIYSMQSALLFKLGTSPSRFLSIYNFTTALKMFMSIIVLVAYYLISSQSLEPIIKLQFTGFFMAVYFLFLTINTKIFFSKKK